jgi:hypothetical protein
MALHQTQTAPQQPIEGVGRGCHLRKGSLPDRADSNHERVMHAWIKRKGVLLITTLTRVFSGTKLAGSANPPQAPATLCTVPRGFQCRRQVCVGGISQIKPPPQAAHMCLRGAEGVPESVGRRGVRGHLPGENGMHEVGEPWKSQCSYLSDCLLRHHVCDRVTNALERAEAF